MVKILSPSRTEESLLVLFVLSCFFFYGLREVLLRIRCFASCSSALLLFTACSSALLLFTAPGTLTIVVQDYCTACRFSLSFPCLLAARL